MSLNWKEIDRILAELDLGGCQIQKAVQSAFDVMGLKLYGRAGAKMLLVSLRAGACRLHETFRAMPKNNTPLRFAEFLNSKIVNARIEEAVQLGDNRIVRITVRLGGVRYKLYIRLWSNAANFIVTDDNNVILDAMRRLPKRGEVTGGRYEPEKDAAASPLKKEYFVREFSGARYEGKSFNENIDTFYAEQGGGLSLESLREQARRQFEGNIARLDAALERLREKEKEFSSAELLKQYGDIILANSAAVSADNNGWLEADNFYSGGKVRIALDPKKGPAANAERYYEQYRKQKSGLEEVRREIAEGEQKLSGIKAALARLLAETNPLVLARLLKSGGVNQAAAQKQDAKRPGLSFRRGDWLLIVGRDAAENDELLRRHVKGNDLWLHARDYPGSYVFVKQRAGKTVPLDILLDAGNLAIFYSKGRNNGEGDLFYTAVKYLRRAKNGPNGRPVRGLVIPTQEKNLHVKVEATRLRELELCRIEK